MMIVDPYRFAGSAPATITFQALTTVAPQVSNVFTGIPSITVGAAASGRVVFLVVNWFARSASRALVSAAIAGVPATIHVQRQGLVDATYFGGTAIISALVPSGTTVSVDLTFASGAADYSPFIGSFQSLNLLSQTAIATDNNNSAGASSLALSVDVQKDGILLSGATQNTSSQILTGSTERYRQVFGGSRLSIGGSDTISANQTGRAITLGGGGSFSGPLVAASFR